MAEITMIQAINEAMRQEMERDERVIVLGEDVGTNGGVFRATDGLLEQFGDQRVFDTPLAESGIIGTSIGLAVNGFRPIAEIQFLGFVYQAMDQLAAQAARIRFRSAGRFTCPIVVRSPYGGGVRTPELHSDALEALFTHSPGLKVVMPSNAYDAKGLLIAAIRDEDPVLFLEPMKLYRAFRMEVPEEPYEIPLGKARIVKEGEDVTIISWGATVPLVAKLAADMKAQGVDAEVIDLRCLQPLDIDTIMQSVEKTGRVMIVHEAVKTNGFGAEIAALISERALFSLSAPIVRVTGYDTPYPVPSVEDDWLPNAARIVEGVQTLMRY
ncbi:alpha-ketoacid dehydrogenase subunit beta [Parageobacillus sp. VR-IP]|jgi:pyruvate dehydrogenase E1 component beta subunit|uniref:Pyruvate dehydrogenase E1 component beta subunit n=2 Tax=Saccharococcus caldoxylosilyticus TaxID=81408 RepID=A0A023DDF7_9BACL|nr:MULTISPECIES: alpha-ketoacid dehydrogenase subunit beta [Parageobacillus]OQP03355.1 alpha-ketoacid dehydrogenase subunit beta [Geobacillus sp. 44B]KYD11313.1 Branched-chain alpha-keto acid dehydrogenase, E1 component, beta subunit [Parageobacillus caldoxylosilyticus]MBB3852623.1 pyruvate dehydrogenase E1 component beta subunit [Parageobacillus caldoxylosilyticus]NUK29844.1 alpha-ketoacid dehydrogenase subunit beta [Parageobacillus sp. VR-IP]QNU38918.1 alpha-ketoacid dehydrogenase subunit be